MEISKKARLSREGEINFGIEGDHEETAGAWGGWKDLCSLGEDEGQNSIDEELSGWAEHVLGANQRIQIRHRETDKRIIGDEEEVFGAEKKGTNPKRVRARTWIKFIIAIIMKYLYNWIMYIFIFFIISLIAIWGTFEYSSAETLKGISGPPQSKLSLLIPSWWTLYEHFSLSANIAVYRFFHKPIPFNIYNLT